MGIAVQHAMTLEELDKGLITLEEYFKAHPDEEAEYIDAMAEMETENFVDYPEDW